MREDRDPMFDRYLDERHGPFQIGGLTFQASDVLAKLDPVAYEEARSTWNEEMEQELRDLVVESFPLPIAHAFHGFLHAPDSKTRFECLKDTWEAVVNLLFALVLGEVRDRKMVAQNSGVSRQWVHSQSIHDRIALLQKTIESVGDALVSARFVQRSALEILAELNGGPRRDWAHRQSMTEKQVADLVAELQGDVESMLAALADLQDVRLVRWIGSESRDLARLETYVGESRSIRTAVQRVTPQAVSRLALHPQDVFAEVGDEYFLLSPIVCWQQPDRGRQVRLSWLKKVTGEESGRLLNYEIFGESMSYIATKPELLDDLDRMKACFVADRQRKAK